MFQSKFVEKIKTHFVVNNFFSPKNRAFCEVMCRNTVQRGRPQMAIYYGACALHAGYPRLQTHTHNV